ncbi:MAG: hypothetical protein ACKO8W_15375 [Dolichospermum sp.]
MTKLFIPNFTIYATIPDGEFTIDPDTGNYVSDQTILEIKARMQGTPATEKKEDPSVDFNKVYLTGYAVTPKLIPPRTLLAREKYQAIYLEPITNTQQEGTFVLAPQVDENRPRVAKALAKRLGMQIQGTFEFGFYGVS